MDLGTWCLQVHVTRMHACTAGRQCPWTMPDTNMGMCLCFRQVTELRRNWTRFGQAAKESPQDSVTVQAVEEIPFERVRQIKATSQEKKATDIQQVLASADKAVISGRWGGL